MIELKNTIYYIKEVIYLHKFYEEEEKDEG